jgi:threonine dehydrogenase-like Zn-dependent dehydrogenase
MTKMKAADFTELWRIVPGESPIRGFVPLDALVRVTTTTICWTDAHIFKDVDPVERRLTISHEPVGVIEKLGSAAVGYREGRRAVAGAMSP